MRFCPVFFRKNFYTSILVVVVLALLFSPVQANNLWWREAQNSGHVILFIFFAFVIYSQVKVKLPLVKTPLVYSFVLVIGFLLGVAIEILQTLAQRDSSLNDLYGNFLGTVTGLCIIATYSLIKAQKTKTAVVTIICAASFLLLGMAPLIQLSWHYMERDKAFPVIVDFDSSWSKSFVKYHKGSYPGVSIVETEPDWSGYQGLRLNIYSSSKQIIDINLRVHDSVHDQQQFDRFNMKLKIQPGFNEFLVPISVIKQGPAGRVLDITNIAGIILFGHQWSEWQRLELSVISLE